MKNSENTIMPFDPKTLLIENTQSNSNNNEYLKRKRINELNNNNLYNPERNIYRGFHNNNIKIINNQTSKKDNQNNQEGLDSLKKGNNFSDVHQCSKSDNFCECSNCLGIFSIFNIISHSENCKFQNLINDFNKKKFINCEKCLNYVEEKKMKIHSIICEKLMKKKLNMIDNNKNNNFDSLNIDNFNYKIGKFCLIYFLYN